MINPISVPVNIEKVTKILNKNFTKKIIKPFINKNKSQFLKRIKS